MLACVLDQTPPPPKMRTVNTDICVLQVGIPSRAVETGAARPVQRLDRLQSYPLWRGV